jgi:hypothetical protein
VLRTESAVHFSIFAENGPRGGAWIDEIFASSLLDDVGPGGGEACCEGSGEAGPSTTPSVGERGASGSPDEPAGAFVSCVRTLNVKRAVRKLTRRNFILSVRLNVWEEKSISQKRIDFEE